MSPSLSNSKVESSNPTSKRHMRGGEHKETPALAIEHTEDQGDAITSLLEENFLNIIVHRDLTQRPRYTTAIRGKE
jgi:methylase of polypeptide subunit release factors